MGALVAGLLLGIVETAVSRLLDPGLTLAATYALFMIVLLVRPTGPVREAWRDEPRRRTPAHALARARACCSSACRWLPAAMCWRSPSACSASPCSPRPGRCSRDRPTTSRSPRAAFFGLGAYAAAVFGEQVPWPVVLLIAACVGLALSRWSSACRRCACPASTSSSSRSASPSSSASSSPGTRSTSQGTVGRYLFLDMTQAADLLAAAGADGRGACSSAGWSAARASALRRASSATTRWSPGTPASTPRAPRSRCSRSAPPSWR